MFLGTFKCLLELCKKWSINTGVSITLPNVSFWQFSKQCTKITKYTNILKELVSTLHRPLGLIVLLNLMVFFFNEASRSECTTSILHRVSSGCVKNYRWFSSQSCWQLPSVFLPSRSTFTSFGIIKPYLIAVLEIIIVTTYVISDFHSITANFQFISA